MAGINRTTGKATDLITFSRASGGTALRKISYGSELVTNGTFDSADISLWTPAAGNTLSVVDGKLRVTRSATTYGGASATITGLTIGKVYKVEIDCINGTIPAVHRVRKDLFSAAYYGDNKLSGTYYFISQGASALFELGSSSNSSSGYFDFDNISVKEVLFDQPDGTLTLFNHPTNIPRIEYDAAGNVKGLLIEEARTNNVTNSEACEFVAQVSGTVTTSTTPAPFGLSSVVKRVQASVLDSGARLSVPVLVGGDNHSSVYVRSRTGADQNLKITSSGTVGATQVAPASGDWVRLGVTASLGAGSRDVRVLSVGDAIDLDIALPQTELGTFPTSYIPTSGATATRAADIARISVSNFGYNENVGTIVADFTPSYVSNVIAASLNRAPNTGGNYMSWGWGNSGTQFRLQVTADNVSQAQINFSGTSAGLQTKLAGSYKKDDFAAAVNGGTVGVDNSGNPPTDITVLSIGTEFNGYLNGHIKSLSYFPRRLTNAQLQSLTE